MFDLVGESVDIDHHLSYAGEVEFCQGVLQHGFASHLNQGFGLILSERMKTGTQSGGKHDGFHDLTVGAGNVASS